MYMNRSVAAQGLGDMCSWLTDLLHTAISGPKPVPLPPGSTQTTITTTSNVPGAMTTSPTALPAATAAATAAVTNQPLIPSNGVAQYPPAPIPLQASAMPAWLLPVALGGGALLLLLTMGGGSKRR